MKKLIIILLLLPAIAQAAFWGGYEPTTGPRIPRSPGMLTTGKCELYACDAWNTTKLDDWGTVKGQAFTVDPNSANYVSHLVDLMNTYDYGSGDKPFAIIAEKANAVPIWVADENDPKWPITAQCGSTLTANGVNAAAWWQRESQTVHAPQGWGIDYGSDHQSVVWDRSRDRIYEFSGAAWDATNNRFTQCNMAYMDNVSKSDGTWKPVRIWPNNTAYTTYGIRYYGGQDIPPGVTGSQIPHLGYTPTVEELRSGTIPHMVSIILPEVMKDYFSGPIANYSDGASTSAWSIPEGAIFRLPSNFDVDAWTDGGGAHMSDFVKMFAKAARDYGFIVNDLGGAVTIRIQNIGGNGTVGGDTSNTFTPPYGSPDPYIKDGGIYGCGVGGVASVTGYSAGANPLWSSTCRTPNQFIHFPWSQLQMKTLELKAKPGATVTAPVINSSLTASGNQGSAFSYSISATNAPTSFTASPIPAGLSFDTGTGILSGTPTTVGTYSIAMTATNGLGTSPSKTLTLTVGTGAPIITSSTTTWTVTQGVSATYQVEASGSPYSYNVTGLPSGLPAGVTINQGTGLVTVASNTAAGSYNLSISATNAYGTGSAVLPLNVLSGKPVIVSAGTASGIVGSPFSYQIVATNSPTTYAASSVPLGLSINGTTGLISGTPTSTGTLNTGLSASNSFGTGTKTLVVTITAKPTITSSLSAGGTQGSAITTYQIVGTNTPTSYGASGLPTGLSVSTSTGAITGTPSASGTFNSTITATNASGTGSATLVWSIQPSGGTDLDRGTVRTVACSGNITTNLQNAIDASADGDTVKIGSGTCSMSSVSFSDTDVIIKGAGLGVTNITFSDNNAFDVTVTAANNPVFRISGISLTNTSATAAGIQITGWSSPTMRGAFRIDHMRFYTPNSAPEGNIKVWGPLYGLIDHNEFVNLKEAQIFTSMVTDEDWCHYNFSWMHPGGCTADRSGGASTLGLPYEPGGAKNLYVEDNSFEGLDSGYGTATLDTDYTGARVVFRYNTTTNAYIYAHWTNGNSINHQWIEVYGNTFTWTFADNGYTTPSRLQGGGTGLFYNNQIVNWPVDAFRFGDPRNDNSQTGDPLLNCQGSRTWDGNAGDASAPGWPCLTQMGRNGGKTFSQITSGNKPTSFPLYLWHNGPEAGCKTTGGTCSNTTGVNLVNNSNYFKSTPHTVSGGGYGQGDIDYSITSSKPSGAGTHTLTYTPYTYPYPVNQYGMP
jgi:hypothetical protein